ncbi:hypothetical protein HMPREF9946_02556 [Acetobacteraceae bacterium AT-5844]|nr:hypothetical protein HMPREF9946_02556 [Acetobacteraceae bacterium AT-5844]
MCGSAWPIEQGRIAHASPPRWPLQRSRRRAVGKMNSRVLNSRP